jgi:hypothetical protein
VREATQAEVSAGPLCLLSGVVGRLSFRLSVFLIGVYLGIIILEEGLFLPQKHIEVQLVMLSWVIDSKSLHEEVSDYLTIWADHMCAKLIHVIRFRGILILITCFMSFMSF